MLVHMKLMPFVLISYKTYYYTQAVLLEYWVKHLLTLLEVL